MKTNTNSAILVPKLAFNKMVNAIRAVADAQEYMEDFMFLSDKKIIGDIKRARAEHQKGKVGSWRALKTRYGV